MVHWVVVSFVGVSWWSDDDTPPSRSHHEPHSRPMWARPVDRGEAIGMIGLGRPLLYSSRIIFGIHQWSGLLTDFVSFVLLGSRIANGVVATDRDSCSVQVLAANEE